MAYQSQDIIRRSATNGFTPAPQARDHQEEVAKLIDVTTCIGCKACQVACSEWNDIRDEIGSNVGVYDNPADLTAKSWTVMRFSEVEQNDKLEWLIRKGWLYALRRSRLPEGMSGGRGDHSVR
ncbi:formate dehydrogenase-O subunit beta [Salmonella enterica subsp. salamae]|nr:formate dehydrogenase-O subunit beta [Salmonella enterica subsp. salamae]